MSIQRTSQTWPSGSWKLPPYMGPSGWIGVWLDADCDWGELADILKDAWRQVAPRKLQQGVS